MGDGDDSGSDAATDAAFGDAIAEGDTAFGSAASVFGGDDSGPTASGVIGMGQAALGVLGNVVAVFSGNPIGIASGALGLAGMAVNSGIFGNGNSGTTPVGSAGGVPGDAGGSGNYLARYQDQSTAALLQGLTGSNRIAASAAAQMAGLNTLSFKRDLAEGRDVSAQLSVFKDELAKRGITSLPAAPIPQSPPPAPAPTPTPAPAPTVSLTPTDTTNTAYFGTPSVGTAGSTAGGGGGVVQTAAPSSALPLLLAAGALFLSKN